MKDRKILVKATRSTTTIETVEFQILVPAYASEDAIEMLATDYVYHGERPQLHWQTSPSTEEPELKITSAKESF